MTITYSAAGFGMKIVVDVVQPRGTSALKCRRLCEEGYPVAAIPDRK
jgi:hypothetical protein